MKEEKDLEIINAKIFELREELESKTNAYSFEFAGLFNEADMDSVLAAHVKYNKEEFAPKMKALIKEQIECITKKTSFCC